MPWQKHADCEKSLIAYMPKYGTYAPPAFHMTPAGPWGAGILVDANGSLRVDTDAFSNPKCHADYYPFGEPVGSACTIYAAFQFAGLYTDPYDANYSAALRRYNYTYYRWFSPDPGGRKVVKLDDPQTWNMYAYVGNNPISRNDPSGEYFVVGGGNEKFFLNALANLYRRPGGRALVESLARSSKPVILGRGELGITQSSIEAGSAVPLALNGQAGVAGVAVTVGSDRDLLQGATAAPGQVGAAITTAHELEHAGAGLNAGKTSLQAGWAAMLAGDKPLTGTKGNTLGGSAQANANAILGEKTDESKKAARAVVQTILKSGNLQWQDSADRKALCAENDLHAADVCN